MSDMQMLSFATKGSDANLRSEVTSLRLEVVKQWTINHYELCGHCILPWPHEGMCHFPLPTVIEKNLTPSEVYLLLLAASGISVGLRLQSPED